MLKNLSLLLSLIISTSSMAYLPNEGDTAPDFEMTSINGESFKLSDFKGKQSVYVVFWNTWCHFCMKKIPKLKTVQNNLSEDIRIIAVNTSRDDSIQETLDFQNKYNINYMLSFDEGEVITDLFNVHGVPTEFIIDINGTIVHRDGVPDNIALHVDNWNKKGPSFAQSIRTYIQIIVSLFNEVKQTA
jgi:peroxiredoxin